MSMQLGLELCGIISGFRLTVAALSLEHNKEKSTEIE